MWSMSGDTHPFDRIPWCLLSERYSGRSSKFGMLTRRRAIMCVLVQCRNCGGGRHYESNVSARVGLWQAIRGLVYRPSVDEYVRVQGQSSVFRAVRVRCSFVIVWNANGVLDLAKDLQCTRSRRPE